MQTKYLQAEIAAYDEAISNKVKTKPFSKEPFNMVVAIENEAGTPYRLILTDGLREYMRVTDKLLDLGMADKLASSFTSKEGYDSRFYFPVER